MSLNGQSSSDRDSSVWSAARSSALLTGSRVLSALAVNKIIAAYLGPSGLALVGQFQNFTGIVFGLANGNASNATIVSVAGAAGEAELRRVISTATALVVLTTGFMALCVSLAADFLATKVMGDAGLACVLHVLSLLMIPLILNVVLLAIVAGLGGSRAFVAINAGIAFLTVPVCWALVATRGIEGGLLAAVLVNGAAVGLTGYWIWKRRLFPLRWLFDGPDNSVARRVVRLAGMTLSTIIGIPLAQLFVRQELVHGFGTATAGQWQAALKVGEVLLLGASVVVSLYFLPKFARTGAAEMPRAGFRASVQMLLVTGIAAVVIGALGTTIIPVLFARSFLEATALLPVQLAGDVVRAATTVLQATFLANGRTAAYVSVDAVYALSMVGVARLSIESHGTAGAVSAVLVASVASCLAAAVFLGSSARGKGSRAWNVLA